MSQALIVSTLGRWALPVMLARPSARALRWRKAAAASRGSIVEAGNVPGMQPTGVRVKQPLEVRFIGMEASPAVEAAAREKAAKLDLFRADLMSCRVTIELVDKHKHQGRRYAVRIDVTLPGNELGVDRVQHEDVYVALRDAFDDMKRQVQDGVRRVQHP